MVVDRHLSRLIIQLLFTSIIVLLK